MYSYAWRYQTADGRRSLAVRLCGRSCDRMLLDCLCRAFRIQRRLTAGAACENLKARCPYFYAAAKEFSDLCASASACATARCRIAQWRAMPVVTFVCALLLYHRTLLPARASLLRVRHAHTTRVENSASLSCREVDPDVDLATVVFNAYRERFHKLAGGALGLDKGTDMNELQQKLSQEEAYRALQPCCYRAAAVLKAHACLLLCTTRRSITASRIVAVAEGLTGSLCARFNIQV